MDQIKSTSETIDANVVLIMAVKNEEKFIEKILTGLFNQDLLPSKIIVINDGSTDRTQEILESFNVEIVNSNRKTQNYLDSGIETAKVINVGFSKLKNLSECEFVVKLDGDHLLPHDYLSKIIKRMKDDPKLAICAGIMEGEYSTVPIHSGRAYRYDFLKKFEFLYPLNFGAEDYFIFKAKSLGLKAIAFQDIMTTSLRKTRSNYANHQTFYNYGITMKALGFAFSYVLAKSLLIGIKHPKNGVFLLKGFFAKNTQLYEPELRDYVKKTQHKSLINLNSESIKRAFNLIKN
jgi:cellulose synthase/poly-beta-1,6-N-acetylglucosamine synthase-like glycosyltransferase